MEGRADLRAASSPRAPLLGKATACSTAGAVPAQHHLAGALSFATSQISSPAMRPRQAARPPRAPGPGSRPSRPCRQAPRAAWPGPQPQQPGGIGDRKGAGGCQRRILAERMAGDVVESVPSGRPRPCSSTRTAASDAAINAGWAFSVRVRVSIGPSKTMPASAWPSAASTSSNTGARRRIRVVERLTHANGLGALSGENCDCRHLPLVVLAETPPRPCEPAARRSRAHIGRRASVKRGCGAPPMVYFPAPVFARSRPRGSGRLRVGSARARLRSRPPFWRP